MRRCLLLILLLLLPTLTTAASADPIVVGYTLGLNMQQRITFPDTYQGNWNSQTRYQFNDIVNYNGTMYVSGIFQNQNRTPGSDSSWSVFQLGNSSTAVGSQGSTQVAGASSALMAGPDYRSLITATRPFMANWLTALSQCNTQVVRIRAFADSRVRSTFGDLPYNARWVDLIRQYAQSICPSHGTGVVPVIAVTNNTSPILDPTYWSISPNYTSGFDSGATWGPKQGGTNGYGMFATNAGGVLNFTSPLTYDHIVAYCEGSTGLGTWQIAVDGANVGTCGSSGSSNVPVASTTSTFSLGTHTTTFTCPAGGAACGLYAAEGAVGSVGVSVDLVAVGSSTAEWWGNDPTHELAFSDLAGEHDLDIIEDIANEPGIGYSTSSFQNALTNIIAHEQSFSPKPSIVLVAPMQDAIGGQAPYYPIIKQVADSTGVGYIDFRSQVGTAQVAGIYESDNFHENRGGNILEYSMIWPMLFPTPFAPGAVPTGGAGSATGCGVGTNAPVCSGYAAQNQTNASSTGYSMSSYQVDAMTLGTWSAGNGAGLSGVTGLLDNASNIFSWIRTPAGDTCLGVPVSGNNVGGCVGAADQFPNDGSYSSKIANAPSGTCTIGRWAFPSDGSGQVSYCNKSGQWQILSASSATTGSSNTSSANNTYPATVNGSPTFGTGKFSQGLISTSDANFLHTSSGAIPTATSYAMEAWLKTTASGALSVAMSTGDGNFWMGESSSGNFIAQAGGTTLQFSAAINDGNWHWCIAQVNNGILAGWVDGVFQSYTGVTLPAATDTSLYIGRYNTTGYGWSGAIDEVAVWNGVQYNGGPLTVPTSPYAGTETNLRVSYPLNGNGNDLGQ